MEPLYGVNKCLHITLCMHDNCTSECDQSQTAKQVAEYGEGQSTKTSSHPYIPSKQDRNSERKSRRMLSTVMIEPEYYSRKRRTETCCIQPVTEGHHRHSPEKKVVSSDVEVMWPAASAQRHGDGRLQASVPQQMFSQGFIWFCFIGLPFVCLFPSFLGRSSPVMPCLVSCTQANIDRTSPAAIAGASLRKCHQLIN